MRSIPIRSTLLRHLLLMVLAYIGIALILSSVGTFRDSQLALMAYFVIAAAGLTILTGLNGQISLGHGALMAIGAYTAALMFEKAEGVPFSLVLIIAVIITSLVGVLVGAAAARLHGPYLAGATLALAVGLPAVAIYPKFEELLGGEQGLRVTPPRPPGWFESTLESLTGENVTGLTYLAYLGWLVAVITLLLLSNLVASRYGRTWRAVRDEEVAAQLCGINLGRNRILAFTVSAACAGAAGVLLAVTTRLVAPTSFTLVLSLTLLVIIVIGGLGSLFGAVLASALPVFLGPFVDNFGREQGLAAAQAANIAPFVYGLVLIFVMLLAPRGLVGTIRGRYLERKARQAIVREQGADASGRRDDDSDNQSPGAGSPTPEGSTSAGAASAAPSTSAPTGGTPSPTAPSPQSRGGT